MMSMSVNRRLLIPPFCLDGAERRLWREGQELTLREKSFDVLYYLLQHAGQLVQKSELLKVCWPNTVVEETALRNCLQEIRAALGDEVKAPRFIQTVPKQGYRFIAPVTASFQPESDAMSPLSLSTFVGRARELKQLEEGLRKAKSGHRQMMFVSGEP